MLGEEEAIGRLGAKPDEDEEGDGHSTLLEFLFDGNPLSSDSGLIPKKPEAVSDGIGYVVESGDLSGRGTGGLTVLQDDGTVLEVELPFLPGGSFMRFRAGLPGGGFGSVGGRSPRTSIKRAQCASTWHLRVWYGVEGAARAHLRAQGIGTTICNIARPPRFAHSTFWIVKQILHIRIVAFGAVFDGFVAFLLREFFGLDSVMERQSFGRGLRIQSRRRDTLFRIHRSDPVVDQLDALGVLRLGSNHRHVAGAAGGDAVVEDGIVGVAGSDELRVVEAEASAQGGGSEEV